MRAEGLDGGQKTQDLNALERGLGAAAAGENVDDTRAVREAFLEGGAVALGARTRESGDHRGTRSANLLEGHAEIEAVEHGRKKLFALTAKARGTPFVALALRFSPLDALSLDGASFLLARPPDAADRPSQSEAASDGPDESVPLHAGKA